MLFEEVYRRFMEGDDDAPIDGVDDKKENGLVGSDKDYLDTFFFKKDDEDTTSYERMCEAFNKEYLQATNQVAELTYIIVKRHNLKSSFNVVVIDNKEKVEDGCKVDNFVERFVWEDKVKSYVETTTKTGKTSTKEVQFTVVGSQGKVEDLLGFLPDNGKIKELNLKRYCNSFSVKETTVLQEKLTGMMCVQLGLLNSEFPESEEAMKFIIEKIGEEYKSENEKKYRTFFKLWFKPCQLLSKTIRKKFNTLGLEYCFVYDNFCSDGNPYPDLQKFLYKGVWSDCTQRDLVNPSDIYFVRKKNIYINNKNTTFRNNKTALQTLNTLCAQLFENKKNVSTVKETCKKLGIPEKGIEYIKNTKKDGNFTAEEYTNVHNILLKPKILIPISLKKPGSTVSLDFISSTLVLENATVFERKNFVFSWDEDLRKPGEDSTIKNATLNGRTITLDINPSSVFAGEDGKDKQIKLIYRNTNGKSTKIQMGALIASLSGHLSAQGGRGTQAANDCFVSNFKKMTGIKSSSLKSPQDVLNFILKHKRLKYRIGLISDKFYQINWERYFAKVFFGQKQANGTISLKQLLYFTKTAASALKYPITYEGPNEDLKEIFSNHNSKIIAYWKCY